MGFVVSKESQHQTIGCFVARMLIIVRTAGTEESAKCQNKKYDIISQNTFMIITFKIFI